MTTNNDIAKRLRFYDFPNREWFSIVSALLGGVQTKNRELKYTFYDSNSQPFNDTNFVFELQFDKKMKLVSSKRGIGYNPSAEKKILDALSELEKGEDVIYRTILFSMRPLNTHYRFKDIFQIVPVPEIAPKPASLHGFHPFVLEVRIQKIQSIQVQAMRNSALNSEYIGILNLAFATTVFGIKPEEAWLMAENMSKCYTGFLGYFIKDFEPYHNSFSNVATTPCLSLIESKKYFSKLYSPVELEAPDFFPLLLERYYSLPPTVKDIFDTALHWLDRADQVYKDSKSLSYIALITSIESMLEAQQPGTKCDICGQAEALESVSSKFRKFIDAFLPGVPNHRKNSLYGLRSKIVHRGQQLGLRNQPFSFWMNNKIQDEDENFHLCRKLVRYSLINWLLFWDMPEKKWWGVPKYTSSNSAD